MQDRRIQIARVVLVALVLVGLPTDLGADDSFESNIEGTWEATDSDEEAREKINEELEKVLGEIVFFKRPFVRRELRDATEPCSTLEFGIGDEDVTIQCDDGKPTTSPKDGTAIEWTSEENETYTLSQKVESDQIVQTFEDDDGTRTNTYSLDDDETLSLDVRIEGDPIPVPLTYSRTFERAD